MISRQRKRSLSLKQFSFGIKLEQTLHWIYVSFLVLTSPNTRHSLKSGPKTRDLQPWDPEPGTQDPGPWNPGTLELGPWNFKLASQGHGALEMGPWDTETSN